MDYQEYYFPFTGLQPWSSLPDACDL